jgi:dCMP deaminase
MKYDKVMMETAHLWAKESYCKRRQVGCVIAKDGRIISIGYNGTVSGVDNICEGECPSCNGTGFYPELQENCILCSGKGLITNDLVMHAEQNSLLFCAKNGISTNGCTAYVTTSPCGHCSKLLASAGIVRVVYDDEYKQLGGLEMLKSIGVKVERYGK